MTDFIISEPHDDDPCKPVQGPVKLKEFGDHKWTISGGTDGLAPYFTLSCEDPCSIPYDPHTGTICCCVWATEPDNLDVAFEDIPVRITREDHTGWNYWGDDYEPGWLHATPLEAS